MTSTNTLLDRNQKQSRHHEPGNLPILPKLRTVIIACADARVDPVHIFDLEPGEAVVMRNNGGRITEEVENEIASLAFLVAQMDGDQPGRFELMIVQHTQCGAERFADPQLQQIMKQNVGVDVSTSAISDHRTSLQDDINRLRNSPKLPGHIIVSGYLYDISKGFIEEIIAPSPLSG